jgi:hypothetical protein
MAAQGQRGPERIKVTCPGSAWIMELIATTRTRKGIHGVACHRFITSLRTTPEALLRLIRQRWSIENAHVTQLGEDAHRCAKRTGGAVFSFLRTVVMNLLTRGGYRSICQGFWELAYDIRGTLSLGVVETTVGTS